MPSDNYLAWHAEKAAELMTNIRVFRKSLKMPSEPIKTAEIEMTITFPDRIKADLTNKAESIMDLLVDMGVLEDDCHLNCGKLTLVSGGVDKKKAGANITIYY